MSQIIKISKDGTDTYFEHDEVDDLIMRNNQPNQGWSDLSQYWHQYFIGTGYKRFTINFRMFRSTMKTRLDTIFGYVDSYYQPDWMILYYDYEYNPTSNKIVRMKRDTYKKYFTFGEEMADIVIPITFYETTPEGVSIHKKRVGV